MARLNPSFIENAVMLGRRRSLVGVVTRPVAEARIDAPAIVILNTGVVHRIGHHRMYVGMARALAAAGLTTLRFDFSGIGDSARRPDQLSPLESCMADIQEVLDSFEASNRISRFVLVGLCSGADHAVVYSPTDSRIQGLVLLDPSLPPTLRYYVHYVAQRLRSLNNWMSVLTGRSGLLRLLAMQLLRGARPNRTAELTLEDLPFSPHLARCYKDGMTRGIRMLAAFTSISPRQTYRQQMLDAFPDVEFKDQLTLEFFADSDHLFSTSEDRSRLNQIIVQWAASLASVSPSTAEQPRTYLPDPRRHRTSA